MDSDESGGLVAIYAAQPHEPTFEAPLPIGEEDASMAGLLTFTMVQVLTAAKSNMTYSELVQRIHSAYMPSTTREHTKSTPDVCMA